MQKKLRLIGIALAAVLLVAALLLMPGMAESGAVAQVLTPTPTAVLTQAAPPVSSGMQRSVTVTGTGRVAAQPDTGVVILGVQTEAEAASEALTQNSDQIQETIDALTQAGIAQADIRTQTIQLYPRYDFPQQTQPDATPAPPRLLGFTAVNTLEVTIRDLGNVGEILDAAVTAGTNQIQGIRFDLEDRTELLDQARQAAFEDAQLKASQLAELAGAELGAVISISETSRFPQPFGDVAAADTGGAAEVPVLPGSQEVILNIHVTFALD